MKSSNTPFPRRRGANQRERRLVQTRACRAPWIYRIVNDAAEQCHRSAPYLQLTPLRVEATYRCCDHGKALGCELSRIPVSDTLRRVICKAVQSARQIQGSQHASSRRRSINVVIRRMLVRLMRPQLSTSFVHLSTGRHTTGGVIVAAVTVSEPVETAIMPRRRARTTTFAPGSLGSAWPTKSVTEIVDPSQALFLQGPRFEKFLARFGIGWSSAYRSLSYGWRPPHTSKPATLAGSEKRPLRYCREIGFRSLEAVRRSRTFLLWTGWALTSRPLVGECCRTRLEAAGDLQPLTDNVAGPFIRVD
jgi:hypothetical protein